ncbi:MAG: hypothetical protein QW050_02550 [Candidatus Nitrosocaldaceae archaeon]
MPISLVTSLMSNGMFSSLNLLMRYFANGMLILLTSTSSNILVSSTNSLSSNLIL